MSKLYYKRIPLPPTNEILHVCVCKDTRRAFKKLCKESDLFDKKYYKKLYKDWGGRIGLVFVSKDKYDDIIDILMYLYSFDLSNISHELFHVLSKLEYNTSIELWEDNEAGAYYMGYLTKKILKMKQK